VKKQRKRSIAVSRAASLKGWRTRKQMKRMREVELEVIRIDYQKFLDSRPTINRIPKVEWT